MNLEINTSGIDRSLQWLATIRNQTDFAAAGALTDVGFKTRAELGRVTPDYFHRPVAYTKKAFRVTPANKRNLTAEVYVDRTRSYLFPQVRGGQRFFRDWEGLVKGEAEGVLPQGLKLVPTATAQDKRGNIRRSLIREISSEGLIGGSRRKGLFVGVPRNHPDKPLGVYRRSRRGFTLLIQAVEAEPEYKPQLPMEEIGNKQLGQHFMNSYESRLARLLRYAL